MAMIEGFRVQNYRVLKDVSLGRTWDQSRKPPLTPLVAVIGKNGSGKSTLFDSFGFIADALAVGVESACDLKQRGGFDRLVSAGTDGPIRFEIHYRESPTERPIMYELEIAKDANGRPHVQLERLRQRRKGQKHGRLYRFLELRHNEGWAWKGDSMEEEYQKVRVELTDTRTLGISILGSFKEHPRITKFRKFIGSWYLSYFTPDAARVSPPSSPEKHLNLHGDNLGNVVQYMERENRERFQEVLSRIARKIPGLHKIDTKKTDDGRVLLRFNDKGFKDPFLAQQVSDGTLKLFAYMMLLMDPEPPPFICIEEPENGLYHKLLEALAEEFRCHATGEKNAPQIFITTHQPYFVNALAPEETWVLEKGTDGFSTVHRSSDDLIVKKMVEQGLPLGSLWYSDYLDAR